MGRKKGDREIPLYVRINKNNDKFLTRLCKAQRITRTAWVDEHLNMLRSMGHATKTRDYFPKEGKRAS